MMTIQTQEQFQARLKYNPNFGNLRAKLLVKRMACAIARYCTKDKSYLRLYDPGPSLSYGGDIFSLARNVYHHHPFEILIQGLPVSPFKNKWASGANGMSEAINFVVGMPVCAALKDGIQGDIQFYTDIREYVAGGEYFKFNHIGGFFYKKMISSNTFKSNLLSKEFILFMENTWDEMMKKYNIDFSKIKVYY